MARLPKSKFRFRKHDTIGAEGAEEDAFLAECFVDVGDLAALRDTTLPKRVVVGRTGAGKTALLTRLKSEEDRCTLLDPTQLALQYLSNSTILRYLEELGVRLDIFYRLLWKHILAIELIQLKYQLRSEEEQDNFLQRVKERLFGDKKKKE